MNEQIAVEKFITSMPSLPATVSKAIEICDNINTSPADLNKVISLDPVLMGKVLKLINSAYYGMSQQVTSLVRAITMLGLNTVKNLALSSAVMGNLAIGKTAGNLDMDGFWRHSLAVGVAAKLLAKKRGIDKKLHEEYFTAGMLHDIGKIPLNAVLPSDYMQTVAKADKTGQPLFRVENQNFGIDHCLAGRMIVSQWKLAGGVGDTIIFHHDYAGYTGANKNVLFTVVAANRFANNSKLGFSGDLHPEKLCNTVYEKLGLESGALNDIFFEFEDTIGSEIEKAKIFLKI
jgi:HD-like signal output (HDOD) protein